MRVVPEGRLVYGMQLPVQAQSELFVEDWERTAGPDEIVAVARKADEAGFFYVAACDHVAVPERLAGAMGTPWYDPVAVLGLVAGVTERVRLLTNVFVLPYRHPLQSAKSLATLDHLSKGRLVIGVGAGHVAEEFDLLGLDFAERGRILDEAIDAVDVALRDEFATFAGPTWKFEGLGQKPRPEQAPRPPIWVGGSSRPALRRAAQRGDGWIPQGTPRAQMPEQIAYLREHREKAGRAGEPFDLGVITEMLYVGDPSWDVGKRTITGTPASIAESLREYGAMGVDHLQIRFRSRSLDELLDQMDAFGARVAPLLDA
jgi:probable F420-dependent oxidoreductase